MLDKIIQAVAIGQTIVTTMRAGSRAFYILKDGEIGVMTGPIIEAPLSNETSELFDLSEAFRQSVCLACENDDVLTNEVSTFLHGKETTIDLAENPDPDKNIVDDDKLHQFLLEESESSRMSRQTGPGERWKVNAERFTRTLSIPFCRSHIMASSLSRILSKRAKSFFQRDDELDIEDLSDSSLDFSKVVSRDFLLGMQDETVPPRLAKVKAYATREFKILRSRFGIPEEEFIRSVLQTGPFVSFQSNSKGAARSGGVFFFTRDGNYMIKTIKPAESLALLQMLPKYFSFMRRNGKKSLLTRVCGMFEVNFEDSGQKSTFIVTNSVFPAEGSKIISERYDLKGSTLGRECSEAERVSKGNSAVLKDLDLLKEVEIVRANQIVDSLSGYGLHVGAVSKAALLTQLRKDVQLLVDCGVIDYSLLVGSARLEGDALTETELRLVDKGHEGDLRLQLMRRGSIFDAVRSSLITPLNVVLAPPLYFYRKSWAVLRKSLFWPLPYYGSGDCGVDAGQLARMYGDRNGCRCLFYFGVIDFLQPFNMQKKAEWKVKQWIYKEGYSCVPPKEYADRFLAFLESNIS